MKLKKQVSKYFHQTPNKATESLMVIIIEEKWAFKKNELNMG